MDAWNPAVPFRSLLNSPKMLGVTAILAVLAAGIAYVAYGYAPSRPIGYRSPFLASQRSEFVDVQGFRIHYLEEGSGPPVLLIHGGGTWLYSYRHNLEPLARHFRVIALDIPGHGYTESKSPGTRYDFETTDRVLAEFLDAKGIPETSLVGHSWGGDWALHFAQRVPERVRKLVLIGSSSLPGDDRLEWKLLKVPLLAEVMTNLFGPRAVEWGLKAAFADPAIVTPDMVEEIYAAVSSSENRWAQVSYSRYLDFGEVQRFVPDTQIPTLVIYGDLDRYGPYEDGHALAEALPDARFELIVGAGHNAHEEKPREINELITGFLSSDE